MQTLIDSITQEQFYVTPFHFSIIIPSENKQGAIIHKILFGVDLLVRHFVNRLHKD